MKIQVIGKAHLEGTSKKTGKPYNFNQIHYNSPAPNVEGLAAQTLMLDPAQFPLSMFTIDEVYDIQFNQRGYVVSVEHVG